MNYKVYDARYTRRLKTEYSDDVRSKRDEPVMHVFKYESEDEPERKIVPAYQSFQVMAAIRVIPWANAHTSPQYPSDGVFDCPNARDVDYSTRYPG